jgi:2-polyprenyl-6-hydroxyphenyl methylase / 3-demethylubiquinone-9 3-methyltransferase
MLSENELKRLHSKEYVESFEKEQSKFRLERLIKTVNLSSEYRVADFGCGNGMLLPLLASKVKSYTGIDFSQEFIDCAERRKSELSISNAEFFCADIVRFCEENKRSYDAAFAMDFSEHVYDEGWLAILKAIRISLKQGGLFYMHTPNSEYFLEIMKKHNFIIKQFPEHVAVRSPRENIVLLEKAGFKINRVQLIPHYNVLRLLHPISYLPCIGRFFKARILIESIVPSDAHEAL